MVALRTAATPDATCSCPHTIRLNGITLLRSASAKNAAHNRRSVGILVPITRMATSRIVAAITTRETTIVNVGSSLTATPMKKNELPNNIERNASSIHSSRFIDLLIWLLELTKNVGCPWLSSGLSEARRPI